MQKSIAPEISTNGKIDISNIHYYAGILYCFLIPFFQKSATIAILLWVILSIIRFKKQRINPSALLLLPVLLFFTYILSDIISGTLSLRILEHKLSLLAFPLIFFLHSYSTKKRNMFMKFFVYGLMFSSLTCLMVAVYNSYIFENGTYLFRPNINEGKNFLESVMYGGNYFFGQHLSIFHQTGYYALYLCAGIAVLLFRPVFKNELRVMLICFFTILIFLVSNKAGFLVLSVLFLAYILNSSLILKKKLILISIMLAGCLVLIFLNPRFKESIKKIFDGELKINQNARYGFTTRILSWDAAISAIKERPVLGYGPGKTQRKLDIVYEKKGYKEPLKQRFNAHNQFLQIWLENGLIGFLVFTSIFIFLFNNYFENRQRTIALSILLIFLLNATFESILNRFSGISFFAFTICLIFSTINSKKPGI